MSAPLALAGGPTDTVAHWQMEETSGTTATDLSGNGNHGVYTNGPTLGVSGVDGLGAQFDGGTQHIMVPNSPSLEVGKNGADFSVTYWIKLNESATGSWRNIMHKGNANIERTFAMWMQPNDDRIHYRISSTTSINEGSNSSASLTVGLWTHVAYIKQGNTLSLYINGTLDSSVNLAGAVVSNTGPFTIGDDAWYAGTACALDDIRIFSRALSIAEVLQIRGPFAGLAGHWKLNETSGVTVADATGLGNDGTYVNAPVLGGSGPHGTSVEFNLSNTDDRVDLPHTVLDGVMDVSVSFWIKTTHTGAASVLSGANASQSNEFLVFFSSSTSIALYKNGVARSFGITSVADNQWHHFVFTWDGTANETVLYQNGVLVGSGTIAGTTGVPISIDPGGLVIAQEQDSVGGSFDSNQIVRGSLDDVRIYNLVLTAEEVAQLGATDLIGHWKLDETTGTLAADSSGLGNDGTYIDGPTLGQSGITGFATEFDGGTQHVRIENNPSLEVGKDGNDFSVAYWINLVEGPTGSWRSIIHKGGSNSQRTFAMWMQPNDTRIHYRISTDSSTNEGGDSASAITVGKWTHVAYVKEGNNLSLYIDGELDHSIVLSGTVVSNTGPLTIGDDSSYPGTASLMDEVRLYARAISAQEVWELYGPVGHWKLDETSGTVAADSSGKGNDGTYENGVLLAQSGVFDYSAGFDGSSTYVNAGEDAILKMDTNITIAAWVKPTTYNLNGGIVVNKEGEYQIAVWSDGTARWAIANLNPGWTWINTSYIVPLDTWTHLVLTYDGASVNTYANGVLVHSYVASGSIGDAHTAENELWIGDREVLTNQNFEGLIDEVLLYNRTLTSEKIAELYGLTGHWKLDETSGTVAADSTIFARDGTYVNDPVLGDCGPYWKSAEFNMTDTNDRVDLSFKALDGAMDASAAFWIKTTRTGAAAVLSGADGGHNNEFLVFFSSDTRLNLYKRNSSYGFTIPSVADDKWTHFVFTWKGNTNQVTLYRNGVLVGSGTMGGATGVPINIDPGGLMLAQEQDSVGGGFDANQTVRGSLDDVRIYNRAIQSDEVVQLHGLMSHWKLDETSGTVAVDSSPNAIDGTYESFPGLGVSGKVDTAVQFNGIDNRVLIPNQPFFSSHTTGGLTVSAWVKVIAIDTDLHGQARQPIVAKGNSGFWEWALYVYDGGSSPRAGFSSWQQGGSSHSEISGGTIPIGVWTHVAATFNDGVANRVYIDGVEVALGTTFAGNAYAGNRPVLIGAREDGQYLNAVIDDVKIYNRPLCPDEIEDLSSGGVNGIRIIKWVETF